jgi:hypothetical protein
MKYNWVFIRNLRYVELCTVGPLVRKIAVKAGAGQRISGSSLGFAEHGANGSRARQRKRKIGAFPKLWDEKRSLWQNTNASSIRLMLLSALVILLLGKSLTGPRLCRFIVVDHGRS